MSGLETRVHARAWAEISRGALAHNIHLLRAQIEESAKTRLLAVVKADAYGHGACIVAPICWAEGITDYGVATVDEGIALRALLPHADIYLMATSLPADAPDIVEHHLVPFVGNLPLALAVSDAAQKQGVVSQVHLDIDTGIGRAGVLTTEAKALWDALCVLPSIKITGVATHFAEADEDSLDARTQNALFQTTLCRLEAEAEPLLVHASNSPALLALGGAAHYGLVRPGLLLYGIEPAPGLFADSKYNFCPVLSLHARVLVCRALPQGATISYGRTYTVPPGGGVYATLGLGYGDGFPRRLGSGVGNVLLAGGAAPICGRICMDQLVVDVSHLPNVKPGDIAALIGTDGVQSITAGQIAEAIQTTPHEVSTCLTSRVPRILTA